MRRKVESAILAVEVAVRAGEDVNPAMDHVRQLVGYGTTGAVDPRLDWETGYLLNIPAIVRLGGGDRINWDQFRLECWITAGVTGAAAAQITKPNKGMQPRTRKRLEFLNRIKRDYDLSGNKEIAGRAALESDALQLWPGVADIEAAIRGFLDNHRHTDLDALDAERAAKRIDEKHSADLVRDFLRRFTQP